MYTEIGTIAAALRKKDSKVRPVKRNAKGKAKPHRYAQAYALTGSDAIGRFLGINVGTPLQKKLSRLAILLFWIAVVCAIIVLAANKFSDEQEVIIYAVATGLSMIPASLIVVLTITMAAGTKRMVKRHVIVRNLRSLEALGAVTGKSPSEDFGTRLTWNVDICSDKTGTLTQGKMVVKRMWIPAKGTYSIGQSNNPFDPTDGEISHSQQPPKDINFGDEEKSEDIAPQEALEKSSALQSYMWIASLANLATVHQNDSGEWTARGDPTEIAIQVLSSRFNWNRERFTAGQSPTWKQIAEFPFDSDVKKMSVIFEEVKSGAKHVFTKGAVERVISSCESLYTSDEMSDAVPMTDEIRSDILENMEALASLGLRVLALAGREYEDEIDMKGKDIPDRADVEQNLVFSGLIGLYDPPRVESAPSVAQCHKAGIKVHMLTGDHAGTARAIAMDVGILPARMNELSKDVTDAMVMTAHDFDKLSDDEIDKLPVLPLVVARCAPNTKVRMIEALHRRKKFAAMVRILSTPSKLY